MIGAIRTSALVAVTNRSAGVLALLVTVAACAETDNAQNPCMLAERPATLIALAENSTRNVYALCLEERVKVMVEALEE